MKFITASSKMHWNSFWFCSLRLCKGTLFLNLTYNLEVIVARNLNCTIFHLLGIWIRIEILIFSSLLFMNFNFYTLSLNCKEGEANLFTLVNFEKQLRILKFEIIFVIRFFYYKCLYLLELCRWLVYW